LPGSLLPPRSAMRICMLSLALSLFAILPVGADVPTAPESDLFTSKVRPILAQNCFKCHGPDDKVRKARLRLDIRDVALSPARSGKRAVVPGKPGESEL